MQFKHKKGPRRKATRRLVSALLLIIAIGGLVGGLYMLLLVLTPNIPILYPVKQIDAKALPAPSADRVYIPKIGVDVLINAGGPEQLENGAWHRFSERGDPLRGGNFILSAHRFLLGYTPEKTRKKSPFYHINKLAKGDQILVDYKGKRYGYEIIEQKKVKPNQVEIEAPLKEGEAPKMTLYSCTFKGEADGRDVFIAKFLGEVKDGMVQR